MNKVVAMVVLLVALSACHAGFGVGSNAQHPTDVATNSLGSAVAQTSMASLSND
jgi:hypothetical protein